MVSMTTPVLTTMREKAFVGVPLQRGALYGRGAGGSVSLWCAASSGSASLGPLVTVSCVPSAPSVTGRDGSWLLSVFGSTTSSLLSPSLLKHK